MFASFRDFLGLVEDAQRKRWGLVFSVAVLASLVDAAGAVMVFVLLKLVNEPEGDLEVPVLGNLSERFPDADKSTLVGWVAVVMVAFFLLRGLILMLQTYLQNRTANEAGAIISRRLLAGYLRMPYSFHLTRNSAESIRNAYQAVLDIVSYVLVPVVMLVSETLVVSAMLLVLLVVAPVPTLLAIAVLGPLVLLILKLVQPRISRAGATVVASHEANLRGIQQSLTGVREIKVLGREEFFVEKYASGRSDLARAFYLRAALTDAPRIAIETILLLLIVGFLGATVITGSSVDDSLSVLGLFGYAALRVMPGLNRALAQLNSLKFGRAAVQEVTGDLEMLEREVEVLDADAEPLPLREQLALENVSFRYAGADRDALTGVDLVFRRGESIGIVGPTGSGKTTLVDIVLGLLPPTSGRVACDGVDIQSNLPGWQAHAGVVPQSVFLLDETLRRNIALGLSDADIDEDALAEAVELAQLGEFVASLPQGLDTVVGEAGARISGGQRQRVAIARALYHHPSVLFFDEGTSALDNKTEKQLIEALDRLRGERTIFTIAHRLSTVRTCDRVVIVRDGRVADVGTYDELAERNVELQQAGN
ncbi:MAG: ABC transporter ATP-binding protein [Thermoleophilaceae bacterium]|nr:ABC transporter ATP-binding protein [Thermoleophilaceae bacterium]